MTRKKSSRGIVREDRADHEQNRASADDRERATRTLTLPQQT
jgi:hypothetical protein